MSDPKTTLLPRRPHCQRKKPQCCLVSHIAAQCPDMSISKNDTSGVHEIIPTAITRKPTTTIIKTRRLSPPRVMTGREQRWLNPNKGAFKLLERNMDILVSRFLYPHLAAVWNPYSWLLEKRFVLAETSLSPQDWPAEVNPLRVLLLSDIHCGIFLKPEALAKIIGLLMELKPDLVTISGDIVTGHSSEVTQFLDALAPLSGAPLGGWYCYGNHDYFGGDPEDIRKNLKSIGITTLKNDSLLLKHGKGSFTHGGQIRLPHSRPILRQSRFCLDEGSFAFRSSLLVVSRGLGSVGLPWRWGADPEAVLIEIVPPSPSKAK